MLGFFAALDLSELLVSIDGIGVYVLDNKIQVGFDAKRAYCNHRGLGTYSRLLIESLACWASKELELYLFTPKVKLPKMDHWPFEFYPNSSIHKIMPRGRIAFLSEIWRGFLQTKEWQKNNLQLYHGLSHELPWSYNESSKSNIKTIVTIHDLIFIRQPELYPWWDRQVYIRKVRHACEVAHSIIAISEEAKKDLIQILNIPDSKIKVIYQAVHPRYYREEKISEELQSIANQHIKKPDMNPFKQALQQAMQKPYIFFVGAFEERKNILRLIKAFSLVSNSFPDLQLVIVGKGRLLNEIENLINKLSLSQRVTVFTDVSSEDLPPLYRGAQVVAYPSLLEGFGLPIVEAMMSKTLVVTSIGSCFPEAGGSAAFYANPLNEEDIAAKLTEALDLSVQDRAKRIELGLEHVKKFHWKNTSMELLNHYRFVLNNKN